jgi:hypothetical protein
VRFFFKTPANRHPERSASQIYRKQGLYGAESKDPGDAYLVNAVRTLSTSEAHTRQTRHGLSPVPRIKKMARL